MATPRCPICDATVDIAQPSAPFCSPRCRQIDLARWLGEQYGVPHVPRDDEDPADEPVDEEPPRR